MNFNGILSLFLCLGFCFSAAQGQEKPNKQKPPRTVSGGMVNGKALELTVPSWPESARLVDLYGLVTVEVLIDVDGNVISSKAISGNHLLRRASEKAAETSKFFPMKIGGETVRVSGFIQYNFMPTRWNWLEIGYALGESGSTYYSSEILKMTFPAEFEEEAQLLRQWANDSLDFKEILIASFESRLSGKDNWLFAVGLNLANTLGNAGNSAPQYRFRGLEDLRILVAHPPPDSEVRLIKQIGNLVESVEQMDPGEIVGLRQKMETKLPLIGR